MISITQFNNVTPSDLQMSQLIDFIIHWILTYALHNSFIALQFCNVSFSCEFTLIWNFILNIMYVISSSNLFAYRKEYIVANLRFGVLITRASKWFTLTVWVKRLECLVIGTLCKVTYYVQIYSVADTIFIPPFVIHVKSNWTFSSYVSILKLSYL